MNSLARTMGNEEDDLTVVALHPGRVATDMQAMIRGKSHRFVFCELKT